MFDEQHRYNQMPKPPRHRTIRRLVHGQADDEEAHLHYHCRLLLVVCVKAEVSADLESNMLCLGRWPPTLDLPLDLTLPDMSGLIPAAKFMCSVSCETYKPVLSLQVQLGRP